MWSELEKSNYKLSEDNKNFLKRADDRINGLLDTNKLNIQDSYEIIIVKFCLRALVNSSKKAPEEIIIRSLYREKLYQDKNFCIFLDLN